MSVEQVVQEGTQKRTRRTKKALERVKRAILKVIAKEHPQAMTVRQIFYRLVSCGAIAKTEKEYKSTVVRLLRDMRLSGDIPFSAIDDYTRYVRKPKTYSSAWEALREMARAYRRAIWDNQAVQVEIWLEKDALAGVLMPVTKRWDVPLLVTRGYPSVTCLHEAAERLAAVGKPALLYYIGDHDPSGLDIPRQVEEGIRDFVPDLRLTFRRVAVTEEQIQEWGLPTRPTKKQDSRSKGFQGESVEVDAIEPAQLRDLAERCIKRHVDEQALSKLKAAEKRERDMLLDMAARFRVRQHEDTEPDLNVVYDDCDDPLGSF